VAFFARLLAPLRALSAHSVGHVARHLGVLNQRLGGLRGRECNERAGKRQRGEESSHDAYLSKGWDVGESAGD